MHIIMSSTRDKSKSPQKTHLSYLAGLFVILMSHPLCLQHIRLLSPSLALFLPLSIRHTNMSISNAQSGVCIHTIRAILLFLLQLFMDYCFHLNVYTLLLHCTHKVGSLSLSLFHSKSIRIGISSSSLLRTMHLFQLWICVCLNRY